MEAQSTLRLALVHDWLTGMRGGEKVLEVLCRLWPAAPLYTLLHRRGSVSPAIEQRPVQTSFLQWLPGVQHYYRYLLPVMPWATRWQLAPCDLVLSVSHCVAKGVRPPEAASHVCYCLTPMRYAWHLKDAYFSGRGPKQSLINHLLDRLRTWDRQSAATVSHFIAISEAVRRRIRDCYGRESAVIYPPVDTDFYSPSELPREDYYLVLSAFAPYKRVDIALDASRRLGRKLVVIGSGQDERKLRRLAGADAHFLGWQPDEVVRDHLRRCRALLFPGEEDFGIVPVEAQACGTPVIALGKGGATETVVPPGSAAPATGIWFTEQTADGLTEAIERFERHGTEFDPAALRRNALRFRNGRFQDEITAFICDVVCGKASRQPAHAA
jgi:glycosyltransferase involved in cell wall biosynthesis